MQSISLPPGDLFNGKVASDTSSRNVRPMARGRALPKPWLAGYPEHMPAAFGGDPDDTLAALFIRNCLAFRDREAYSSFGVSITYGEVMEQALKVASYLQQCGLSRGDRVAIMMPNVIPYPVVMFGALIGGFTVVNVNPLYTARELTHQVNDAGARVLFAFEPFSAVVEQARTQLRVERIVVARMDSLLGTKGRVLRVLAKHVKRMLPKETVHGAIGFSEVLQTGASRPPTLARILPEDVAFLQYSGGTTGVAKGAVVSHANLVAHLWQLNTWSRTVLDQKDRHRMLTVLPMYHAAALMNCVLMMFAIGGSCILVANPRDLEGLIRTMRKQRFTMMAGINTLYAALERHPQIKTIDLAQCVFYAAGGAPTQPVVAEKWQALSGRAITEGYGLSETCGLVSMNPVGIGRFTDTAGLPTPGTEIAILSEAGDFLPAGEIGEICVRGPQVTRGYWQRETGAADVFTPDGFFRTGDVGHFDESGFLKIVDRKKDMILVSGFNVFPNEVEDVLARHPTVAECAVIGVPDGATGEAVVAYVVARDKSVDSRELLEHCYRGLTRYKVPKRFEFRDDLPKSPIGKILRRELRAEHFRAHGGSALGAEESSRTSGMNPG